MWNLNGRNQFKDLGLRNEPPGSIKCWEVLEWLHNWQLLKKGWAPWISEWEVWVIGIFGTGSQGKGWEDVNWIKLAQDIIQRLALLSMIINFRFPWKERNVLSSWATFSFSRPMFHWVGYVLRRFLCRLLEWFALEKEGTTQRLYFTSTLWSEGRGPG
jgi:hypothetical protein